MATQWVCFDCSNSFNHDVKAYSRKENWAGLNLKVQVCKACKTKTTK